MTGCKVLSRGALGIGGIVALGVSLYGGSPAAAPGERKAPETDLLHNVLSMEGPRARVLGVNPNAALKNFCLAATPWSQALGTRVSAQGVVWETSQAPPFVGRLVLDGDALYLKGDAISGKDLSGKLMRLEGKLRVGNLERNGAQAYFLDVEQAEPIERITSFYLWEARKRLGR